MINAASRRNPNKEFKSIMSVKQALPKAGKLHGEV